jgi:hypothetical protein
MTDINRAIEDLNTAVHNRAQRETAFIAEVRDELNNIIQRLGACANAISNGATNEMTPEEINYVTRSLQEINTEIETIEPLSAENTVAEDILNPIRNNPNLRHTQPRTGRSSIFSDPSLFDRLLGRTAPRTPQSSTSSLANNPVAPQNSAPTSALTRAPIRSFSEYGFQGDDDRLPLFGGKRLKKRTRRNKYNI